MRWWPGFVPASHNVGWSVEHNKATTTSCIYSSFVSLLCTYIEQQGHSFFSHRLLSPLIRVSLAVRISPCALPIHHHTVSRPVLFLISNERPFPISNPSPLNPHHQPFLNSLLYVAESTKLDIQIPQYCWR